jgi:DNA polymerase-3 subunit epsilon
MFLRSPEWDKVTYWALDLETGGLDADSDAILAVGMVPVRDGTIRLSESFKTLVKPGGMKIQPSSIQAHQLVPGEVEDAPPLSAVLDQVEERLAQGVLLVHQAAVDVVFLKRAHRVLGRRWTRPVVVDTVDLLLKLAHRARFTSRTPEAVPELNLSLARAAHGLPEYPAHDPLMDALATAELFLLIRHRLAARRLRDLT